MSAPYGVRPASPTTGKLTAEHLRAGFPFRVGVGIRRAADTANCGLWPQEEALLGDRAAARRRLQFTLGRAAARVAMEDLGMAAAPVLRGSGGEPLWPEGVVGSIAHTSDLAVSVVGRAQHYAGVGIDVEAAGAALSGRAAARVCSADELAWARAVERESALRCMRLFSAKEAVFKAFYPAGRVWLGFHDAELVWRPEAGRFTALLRRSAGADFPPGFSCQVSSLILEDVLLSSTYVPA